MPAGVLAPGAEPLAGLLSDLGSVEGLRLLGGGLVLKIEHGGTAVQIDLGNVAGLPVPRNGQGRGAWFARSTGW